ncbi:MAG: serine/threonine protein kinase [Anaerolineae bacterium]|nr:MAG: serine/threonine protein kinase [Anaerolineae bacterium]
MKNRISQSSSARLENLPLAWARFTWALIAALTLSVILAAYPGRIEEYFVRGIPQGGVWMPVQLESSQTQKPVAFFSWYFIILDTLLVLGYYGLGLLIFFRKSASRLAIFMSGTLMLASILFPFFVRPLVREITHPWYIPATLTMVLSTVSVFVFLLIFPNGKFVPGWSRWLIPLVTLWELVRNNIRQILAYLSLPVPIFFQGYTPYLVFIGVLVSGFAAQVYRYRYVATHMERQQMKWMILGTAGELLGILLVVGLNSFAFLFWQPGDPELALILLVIDPLLYNLFFFFLLFALAFSILRYRLWDIDYLLNRSLIYGTLTLVLGAVFLAGIFLLQRVFLAFVDNEQTSLSAVIATLIVAGLFQPSRNRLRLLVDRRLFDIHIDYEQPPRQLMRKNLDQAAEAIRQATFEQYQNLELIGRGGMSEVYKATHPDRQHPVALKILPSGHATDDTFLKRFQREARIIASLQHPNIIEVLDFGELNGTHYIVMPFVTGSDLKSYLNEQGPLPLAEAMPMVREIASALAYAHQQGLVHRDIKPSNILLEPVAGPGGGKIRALLTDFGIAKMVSATTLLTETGGMVGTLEYIAPEQIRASRDIDARADLYSFGVMVFQMLTGRLPFKYDNAAALLMAHLSQPAPDPRSLVRDLSPEVAAAIQQALEKQPEQRQATVLEFVDALS